MLVTIFIIIGISIWLSMMLLAIIIPVNPKILKLTKCIIWNKNEK